MCQPNNYVMVLQRLRGGWQNAQDANTKATKEKQQQNSAIF